MNRSNDVNFRKYHAWIKKDPYRAGAAFVYAVPFDSVTPQQRETFKTAFMLVFRVHGMTVLANNHEFTEAMIDELEKRGLADSIQQAVDAKLAKAG